MSTPSAAEYDVIVIGGGAVGENVADRTVQAGLRTVIVEAELVGGECSYWACMPSKALLRPAAALRAAQAVDGARQAVTGDVDVAAVLRRRDGIAHEWSDDSQVRWLDGAGIDLVRGHARLTGPRQVEVRPGDAQSVDDEAAAPTRLTARHAVVIATGSAALLPDIPGLREAAPWTSRDATSVEVVPRRLAIIGGGVVGCEMATAFAGFGTEVTVIARSGLLGGMEPFAADAVAAGLRTLGATVRTGISPVSVQTSGDEKTLHLDDGTSVTVDEILVATGRVPRTGDVGLESVGLEPGSWLDVDDTLRVRGVDGLYAVGDVTHRALLTHQGKYQARAAGDAIAARAAGSSVDDAPWGAHVATADHRHVPQVTFTDPEVASVGLTEKAARDASLDIRVLDYDLGWVAGASTHADDYPGAARAVVDTARGVLVGATFVGPDVAELLHAATIAIVGEVPIDRLWHAVPAYPTISEVWLRWLEEYGRPTP